MKLGPLKAAIRELSEAPKMQINSIDRPDPFEVVLQKTPLLAELDRHYPGGRAVETAWKLTEDGYLVRETN